MAKNWTQKLRVLQRDYNVDVVVASGPYEGRAVVYRPRYDTDRQPWLLWSLADGTVDTKATRFNGRDCRPVYPDREEN